MINRLERYPKTKISAVAKGLQIWGIGSIELESLESLSGGKFHSSSVIPNPNQMAKTRVQKMSSLVSQLMSRRGYAQIAVGEEFQASIGAAVGQQLIAAISVGNVKQGVLQIYASDSVTLQELNFQKRKILKRIQQDLPQSKVTNLRFRIQAK